MEAKLIVLLVLSPLAVAYDFLTNPAAPPQILVAQFTEGFGRPPGERPVVTPMSVRHKHVYLSRP